MTFPGRDDVLPVFLHAPLVQVPSPGGGGNVGRGLICRGGGGKEKGEITLEYGARLAEARAKRVFTDLRGSLPPEFTSRT